MATYTLGSFDFKGNKYIIKDTTYESKSAAQGDGSVSLVTRNEKYVWNQMIPLTQKGAANGVAPLNANGTIDLNYLPESSKVEITRHLTTGTQIATFNIDGSDTTIYAPTPTTVSVSQILTSGTKIATITINGNSTDIYSSSEGGGGGGTNVINTKTLDGLVSAPTSSNPSRAWATDSEGNPNWRQIGITATTSEDALGDGLVLELKCGPV